MPWSRHTLVPILFAASTFAMAGLTSCLSPEAYEQTTKESENARVLSQNEQRRAQELALSNKRMKQQIEDLEAALRDTQDKLVRTEREWRETRDELLRIKIEREQGRAPVSRSPSPQGVEATKPAPQSPPDPGRKPAPGSEDAKRRLRELLEQLQVILQQF